MADNIPFTGSGNTPASSKIAATKEVSFSGDTTDVQLIELVSVTGTEGSRTLNEISTADGVLVNLGSNNDVTVTGTVTANLGATDNAVLDSIDTAVNGTLTVDGSGVTQPVSGTVTANLGATDNAVLDAIQAATEATQTAVEGTLTVDASGTAVPVTDNGGSLTVDNTNIDNLHSADFDTGAGTDTTPAIGIAVPASGGAAVITGDATNGLDVDVTRVSGTVTVDGSGVTQPISASALPLPSGAATAANQSTANTALNAIQTAVEGTVAVSNAGLTELAAAINSSQLDINIASDSVGIGGGTQYTEDDAAAANPTGNMPVLVRADSPATVTSADGDVVAQRATNYGAAYVQVVDSSGNFVDSFSGSGGTSATDDAAFTAGSGSGTPAMGYFSSDTVDAGDVGVLAMDASRRLLVSIEADNAGIGGGTQYTEDAAAPANPVGNALMAERDDALGGLTPAEGDWTHLYADANGALWTAVNNTVTVDGSGVTQPVSGTVTANLGATDNAVLDAIQAATEATQAAVEGTLTVGSHAVTNAGTFAVQEDGAALTALQLIDDVVYADDADWTDGTSKHALVGGLYQSTPQTVTDGDVAPFQIDSNGNIIESNSAAILADTANMDTNLGTIAGAVSGSEMQVDVITSALPTGAATAANQSTMIGHVDGIEGLLTTIDADTSTLAGAVTGTEMQVDIVSSAAIPVTDNGGSLTVDGTVSVSGTVTVDLGANNDVIAAGDVASDSVDSGNPVKVGHVAKNFDGTAPGTAVAEDDRVNSIADVYGRQYVETTHPNHWTASADYASAQTNATVKAAPGAGLRLYITDVIISNGATAGNITLLDGSGGTVKLEIYPAANGGVAMPFRTPIALTANTALVITSTTVTTHSVTVNGYIAP